MPVIKKNVLLHLFNLIIKKGDTILRISVILIFAAFGFIEFFEFEARALEPLIMNTWLEVFHYFLGLHGTSYFLGMVEVLTVFLLFAGFKRHLFGVAGAALVIVTGMVTLSLQPQMKSFDAFIFKDILLIGIGLTLVNRDLLRLSVTPSASRHGRGVMGSGSVLYQAHPVSLNRIAHVTSKLCVTDSLN